MRLHIAYSYKTLQRIKESEKLRKDVRFKDQRITQLRRETCSPRQEDIRIIEIGSLEGPRDYNTKDILKVVKANRDYCKEKFEEAEHKLEKAEPIAEVGKSMLHAKQSTYSYCVRLGGWAEH